MPAKVRLTRRFPAAMSEAGYRRLRQAAKAHDLNEGQLMSFVFENFDALIDAEALGHRLPRFKAACAAEDARKATNEEG